MRQWTLTYVPYPGAAAARGVVVATDLGSVFMCGYPIALKLAPVVPIAAPIPRAAWAGGQAVYRSDLIVREDSPLQETRRHLRRARRLDGGALAFRVQCVSASSARAIARLSGRPCTREMVGESDYGTKDSRQRA